MLINGLKTLIIRCRFCGRLRQYDINLFEAMKNNSIEYICKCGEINARINKGINNDIRVELGCFPCGDKHYYSMKLKDVLRNDNRIYCYQGFQACFIGSKKVANQILLEKQMNLREGNRDTCGEDYFNNFKVLGRALKHLYVLNQNHKITCDCGNSSIDVELFPDRIELKCDNCHSVNIIFAETDEDLSILLRRDKIVLKEHNITCIDSIKEKNRDIKK